MSMKEVTRDIISICLHFIVSALYEVVHVR